MRKYALALLLVFALSACNLPNSVTTAPATEPAAALTVETATSTQVPATATETATITPSLTSSPTLTPTSSNTPTPSDTTTPSITPTYAILRGTVNVEKATCRYGPGGMFLYFIGLNQGATQDIIGRTDTGTWVLTVAHGDNRSCWVKTDLMNLNGDVLAVQEVDPHIRMPWSPYYGPLTGVSATREGNEVRVTWDYLELRAGDSSEQIPYVIEAWVCKDGQLTFTPLGFYDNVGTVTDEPGCGQPSHGVVMAAEKHGYTWPVEIPWP